MSRWRRDRLIDTLCLSQSQAGADGMPLHCVSRRGLISNQLTDFLHSSGAAPSHMPVGNTFTRDSARPMPRGIPGLEYLPQSRTVSLPPASPRHCHIACSESEIGYRQGSMDRVSLCRHGQL
ncbi:hypothetical protein BDP55DRAFT_418071 [Colletotrichum godetiae]|uniref:Uncharacterized protein n=1 Tax=Colletotrichum godetiae TaxID=1209918 RepID=A0AAJ0ENP5_9PEZI|nr:uncharacterized protein BDP55DRAFT_418071 [Colletotrichum godetiae]KAK1657797.1 hypothetical protein BDP55DRAFT_418071 [Colletotrichum godetiae]